MAIDFDEVFETLHSLQIKIDEIRAIVKLASDGGITVPYIGDINLTAAQKNILKTEYDSLKVEVATIWQSLP